MKFGIIKSKIESLLSESYKKDTFKKEIKKFKTFILENNKFAKLFQIYNELNMNKGLDETSANDFINECIKIYENTINKISYKEIYLLENWVKDINVKNNYEKIDSLLSNDITLLEKKIESRKLIRESLKKKKISEDKTTVKLPLTTMINVANKTISNYIESLTESEKLDLRNLLSISENDLNERFISVQKDVIGKLESLKESSDEETKQKINETINKVLNEECDRVNYIKLKNLKENL